METETIFFGYNVNDPDTALMISMGRQPSLDPDQMEALGALRTLLKADSPWLYLAGGRAYSPRIYLVDGETSLRWGSSYISLDELLEHGTLFPDISGNELVLQYTIPVGDREAVFNLRCALLKDVKLNEVVVRVRKSMLSLKQYLAPESVAIPFLEIHREEFTYPLEVKVRGIHSVEMKDWNDGRGPQESVLVKVEVAGSPYLVKSNYKTGTILKSKLLKAMIDAVGVVDIGKTRLNLARVTITEDCFEMPF